MGAQPPTHAHTYPATHHHFWGSLCWPQALRTTKWQLMHILAAGSGLQQNINNSVVVIIISLPSLLNTSADLDMGTEILSNTHSCLYSHTYMHSETLFIQT